MISFDQVTLTYPEASRSALRDVSLDIPEGELVLVLGRTGAGKSTLLRAVNGLVPHFTGGVMSGQVTVAGRDTRHHRPRDLADVVGMVLQDPRDGFVADVVEDEIAYGMESLGLASDTMRRRVEESLDLLGLHELRHRHVHTLSGGEQQRTAIASVLAAHPKVLVLDEPTSALDPAAAEEVLAALQRLVHDLGITVLMAEHRLERVVQFADRIVRVNEDGGVQTGDPATMLSMSPVAPPVVELGRYARWSPLPLSVRDARRHSGPMREQLARLSGPEREQGRSVTREAALITIKQMTASYGPHRALHRIDITIGGGEIVAIMGRNGSGKSTLLRSIVGLTRPAVGQVHLCGHEPHTLAPKDLVRYVGMVPQEPADLLWRDSVAAECRAADTDAAVPSGTALNLFLQLAPAVATTSHPRDLSEGQRLALALAVILAADPQVLLLDEPTRGLDYPTKARLGALLKDRAAAGRAVVLATHDVELVAEVCNRTIVLAEAEVVADGPTLEVVLGSPQFAPQVAKVLSPLPWLTVNEVAATLPEAG